VNYVLAPEAEAELADAVSFCSEHFGRAAAKDFLKTFESKVRLISEFPGVGTATPKGRRLFPIGRYPFSVLYRVDENVILIGAVAHHSRRPGYWKKRT